MNTKESATGIGAVLLAFLATQHHNLHMLLMAVGLGGAGMGFMSHFPLLRRAMLLMSLLMAGWTLLRLVRRRPPMAMRVAGGVSVGLTLLLAGWSVYQFGV